MPKKLNIDVDMVIEMYLSNRYTTNDICRFFQVSKPTIRKILLSNNIETKLSYKYQYFQNVFEDIDKSNAYWLGFLFADGYVRKRKFSSELKLKLSILDKEHLLKFKSFISNSNLPLFFSDYRNSKCLSISVNSNKIVDDLIKLGCVSKKSKIIKFPNIDGQFKSHFIRGYFDGDGCISYGKSVSFSIVSGSEDFLLEVSRILNSDSNCKMASITKYDNCYRISYSTKDDLEKIYNYLYPNSDDYYYLDRKKTKYKYVIDNYVDIKNSINQYRSKN